MIVHRVIPGDTLWDIAAHYLGDPFQYPELARLSQIRNPDLIYPGDVIRIIKKGG
jgi:nucleoid-associated protein YgaU